MPGYKALEVLERQLAASDYLLPSGFSVADIALYAYTHVAHEGGFELTPYPRVRGWLDRVASRPQYVAMRARDS